MTSVKAFIATYFTDDDGAVTVDWIVLVGVIVMLGMGAAFYVTSSIPHVANNMSSFLSKTEVN